MGPAPPVGPHVLCHERDCPWSRAGGNARPSQSQGKGGGVRAGMTAPGQSVGSSESGSRTPSVLGGLGFRLLRSCYEKSPLAGSGGRNEASVSLCAAMSVFCAAGECTFAERGAVGDVRGQPPRPPAGPPRSGAGPVSRLLRLAAREPHLGHARTASTSRQTASDRDTGRLPSDHGTGTHALSRVRARPAGEPRSRLLKTQLSTHPLAPLREICLLPTRFGGRRLPLGKPSRSPCGAGRCEPLSLEEDSVRDEGKLDRGGKLQRPRGSASSLWFSRNKAGRKLRYPKEAGTKLGWCLSFS